MGKKKKLLSLVSVYIFSLIYINMHILVLILKPHTNQLAVNRNVPVYSRTIQTKDVAKTNRGPLWIFHTTITALIIPR